MKELVYQSSNGILDCIKNRWPNSKIEDASDFIHEERFSLEISDLDEKEFWRFALKEGFSEVCLGWKLFCMRPETTKESLKLMQEVLDSIKEDSFKEVV